MGPERRNDGAGTFSDSSVRTASSSSSGRWCEESCTGQ